MKLKYFAGLLTIALFTVVTGCSDGANEVSAENCNPDNLRQMSDEKAMWDLSGRCMREGAYKLNS
ncbi:entry exclusion lipoprotein TrbK [Marinomonas ostreistagni]|uniref:entry exclusion lipoprotein TrbK n=1 Tax=Marinomonas ostreistagni TaxID=359209 RepID=UPI0019521696|nr:entry exclusion lipoprotein TrbK [Marinomonas ostreistagni]MBM6551171.1 entry exclusion lipoprotein TrbK [Marinomonas ostreistagni]